MTQQPVVIVGAGPAGLASAAELGRSGVPAVVLEGAESIAASWRRRYDRLRLNSSKWFSQLPGARFARGTDVFPARDEMVRYLEDYAKAHAIDVRLSTRVERIDRDAGEWVLRTSAGDMRTEQVIVAGGYANTPKIPAWPGHTRFRGRVLHVAAYRNAEPFRGADVLVVGPGCSGMEIAYDLALGGAGRVRLAVRTPPNLLVRNPAGPLLGRVMMKLPAARADAIMNVARRIEFGDLTAYGLPQPEEGMFSRLRRLQVAPAIVDKVVIEAIKDGRIEIVGGVESLDETGAVLAGGGRVEPDAIIAATGYRRRAGPAIAPPQPAGTPASCASSAICTRLLSSSLASSRVTCALTVATLM
jgi:putative flavoprotein involved in K+ transport